MEFTGEMFKTNTRLRHSGMLTAAFTRYDLVVIVAIVAALVALSMQASRVYREDVRRTACRANLGKIGDALRLFADDNLGALPDCSRSNRVFSGRGWPWDLNTNLVTELEKRGATRASLYCPSNPDLGDKYHWDFPKYDKRRTVRIVGYNFLLNGIGAIPEDLRRTNLWNIGATPPAQAELVTDAVACTGESAENTMDAMVANRCDYTKIIGLWTDRTSHLRGWIAEIRPAGGNILFDDQHVEWRDFHQMKHRFATGNIIWDF